MTDPAPTPRSPADIAVQDFIDHHHNPILAQLNRDLADVRSWKEQAMTVLDSIQLQEIGKELGVPVGDIAKEILPAIQRFQRELGETRALHALSEVLVGELKRELAQAHDSFIERMAEVFKERDLDWSDCDGDDDPATVIATYFVVRIETLKRELAEAQDELVRYQNVNLEQGRNIIDLTRDKERLDWLELKAQEHRYTGDLLASEAPSVQPGWKYIVDRCYGDTLREAIDAARRGE